MEFPSLFELEEKHIFSKLSTDFSWDTLGDYMASVSQDPDADLDVIDENDQYNFIDYQEFFPENCETTQSELIILNGPSLFRITKEKCDDDSSFRITKEQCNGDSSFRDTKKYNNPLVPVKYRRVRASTIENTWSEKLVIFFKSYSLNDVLHDEDYKELCKKYSGTRSIPRLVPHNGRGVTQEKSLEYCKKLRELYVYLVTNPINFNNFPHNGTLLDKRQYIMSHYTVLKQKFHSLDGLMRIFNTTLVSFVETLFVYPNNATNC